MIRILFTYILIIKQLLVEILKLISNIIKLKFLKNKLNRSIIYKECILNYIIFSLSGK